jgi:hypothetical protein
MLLDPGKYQVDFCDLSQQVGAIMLSKEMPS